MRNAIKVLIVDDDKASATMMGEVIKRMGFKPVVTYKPTDALNVVRLQTVHAAIVDVLLPKMSGVELVTEFRKTKFADNPVIFVSGVFKDKNFATETIKKTDAVEFLFKPFDAEDLLNSVGKAMQNMLSLERWTVQSLLTRKLKSDRERAKAIERLEKIKGFDFPFVLSILMEIKSSGHLNIVNDGGEIFGVTLIKGEIAEVDSNESQSTGVLTLISDGYLSQEDWDEFQKTGNKRFSLEKLVQEGYVSPHAISRARYGQIMHDFRAICASQTLQVNFVAHEEGDEPPKHAVKLQDMMSLLESAIDDFFPEAYLKELYASVISAPIRAVNDADEVQTVWAAAAFRDLESLKKAIQTGGTLEQALEQNPAQVSRTYQCLHYLVLNRAVMFDDLVRAKNNSAMLERYKKLYAELKDKTADKIFEYFGANANSSPAVVQGIFDEFAKSNHPDQLGKDVSSDLKDLCKKCFDLVSHAYEIMVDETKRNLLFEQLKEQHVQAQRRSQQLMNEGLESLRKGQAKEAVEMLREAEHLYPSSRQLFILIWAEIKAGAGGDKTRIQEMAKRLDLVSADERKTAFYYMALGLIKKAMGDVGAATAMFEKTLQMDSQFADAKRELRALQDPSSSNKDPKKLDILNGDITEIVSSIFRRKAD